ncbi:MAG: NAD(P)-dependent alcohol dehydrogenase, partial [Vicinamibacterales bacterium]
RAFAAASATSPLGPFTFDRREPGAEDVVIEILFCGVCHSDLHTVRSEWEGTLYPCVPGHEIAGRVSAVGSGVTRFKVGDLAAVGCMVDSCRECDGCREGLEQYCDRGATVFTYNSLDPHRPGDHTYGGYSSHIVVAEAFCLSLSPQLDTAAAAPLLCAGITTYSPLRHCEAGPGKRVGIVGLGGLGHMGLKFAHALGAETALFTTSPGKIADGKRFGADQVVLSRDADAMRAQRRSFDLIIDTLAVSHDLDEYLSLLKRDGALVLVGAPETPHPSPAIFPMLMARRTLAGSGIGGIKETQEMLDFCAREGIVCDIEKIAIGQINDAYERMLKSDVKYRFVIDMASLK